MKNFFQTSFLFSLLRNSIVQLLWWIVFFPGFYSGDSFGAVLIAKTGELTNSGTASWALYVRIFSLLGNAFPLLTLISGLVLVYAVTRFAYAIFGDRVAATSSFVLTLTPIVAGMGITLWHDIPFTSGLLILTAFFVHMQKTPEHIGTYIGTLLIPGAILISFKPNGLPTLLVFTFFMLFSKISRPGLKYAFMALLLTATVTLIGSNVILNMNPINNNFAQEWMRGDISCYANTPQGQGFVEKAIPGIGATEKWASKSGCAWLNSANLTSEERIESLNYVPAAWMSLAFREPVFLFQTHLERHAYLVPFPVFGIPTEPFLHSTIEFKDQGIEWAFPSIANTARLPMRLWNAGRGLTGWAGLWLLILVGLGVAAKRKELLPAILMSIALMGILFVVAPIPDGRYALFVLIAGQMALIGKLFERVYLIKKR